MDDTTANPVGDDSGTPGKTRRTTNCRLGRGMAVILLIGSVIAGFTIVLGVMSFAILGRDDVPDPQVDLRDQREFRDGFALVPGDEVTDLLGSAPEAPKQLPVLGGGCIWKGADGTVLEIQLHPRDPEDLPDGDVRTVEGATIADLGVLPVSVAGDPDAEGRSIWVRTDEVTARVELSRTDAEADPLLADLGDALARRLPLAEAGPPPTATPTTLGVP
ncbi:MAG: hypothetical protein KDB24_16565 [Microthrixaceae bacterium]|nr:hypothetical protein [Microthrixaceae bacterium]